MIPLSLKWKIAQYFEIRWWKNYLAAKPKDEYLQWKKDYWQQFLKHAEDIVPLNKSLQILDAGCGPAGIFTILDNHKVDAVDPLLSKYETLNHFSKTEYPHVSFTESKIEDYKKEDAYDVVFCLNAINHVEDLETGLQNLTAALKTNGTLLLSVDAHRFTALKYLFRLIPGDMLHPHQLSLDNYVSAIENEELKILKIEKIKGGGVFDYYLIIAKNEKA
jgi:2-polyprenyl-3-methyl-5-hydroxy-6-metoxy-1,4-benzoquinol methylase